MTTFLCTMVLCFRLLWFGEMNCLLLQLAWKKAVNVSEVFYLDTSVGDSQAARCLERLLDTCCPAEKRSTKQGEQRLSGSSSHWVTALEVLPCPRVYPSNTSVTRLSCLPSLQQCLGSLGSPVPTHPVCSLGTQPHAVALKFKVLCSCRVIVPWEGWENPAWILGPWQFYLDNLMTVSGYDKLGMRWLFCVMLLPSLGRQGWGLAPCRFYAGDVCEPESLLLVLATCSRHVGVSVPGSTYVIPSPTALTEYSTISVFTWSCYGKVRQCLLLETVLWLPSINNF